MKFFLYSLQNVSINHIIIFPSTCYLGLHFLIISNNIIDDPVVIAEAKLNSIDSRLEFPRLDASRDEKQQKTICGPSRKYGA